MKKGSETLVIKRSQIQMNPYNPKRHTDKEIKLQVKNIRSSGYLGGVVWNRQTNNLVDGHRRIKALDIINKYDGTPETDYEIKVEVVDFDKKAELNQLAFMALGNSKADYNLVANIIDDIDYSSAGISDEDYQRIRELQANVVPDVGMGEMDSTFISPIEEEREPVTELNDEDQVTTEDIIQQHEEQPHMTKEQVKAEKAKQDSVASNRQEKQDLYVWLSFSDVEQKMIFCELLGITMTNSMMIPADEVLNLIQ